MIFRTITNESTGTIKSIGLFGKTIDELKKSLSNIKTNGLFNSIFNVSSIDGNAITKYNLAITEAIANNATMAEKQQIMKTAMEGTNRTTAQLISSTNGATVSTEALTAAQKASTLTAKAHSAALKATSIAGNVLASIGLSLVISKTVSFISDMITANKRLLESAKELSSEFKDTESSINDYKEKIKELYETINSNSSSINDVTQARKDLMVIQDELIKKFGDEKDIINIVTDAVNGQTDALDRLSERQYQQWKNEFNNKDLPQAASDFLSSDNIANALYKLTEFDFQGAWDMLTAPTESNIDKMINSMNRAYYEIEKSGNKTLDDLISKTYGLVNLGDKFEISGNLDDINENILGIQEMAKDFNVSDSFNASITNAANAVDETLESYKTAYDTYILYEKILDDSKNTGYDKQFDQINTAKEAYNDAFESGNEDKIKQAGINYAKNLQSAISSAMENSDKDVANYFKSMHPEMQQIFGEWKFEINFEPNTDDLKTIITDALDEIDGKSDGTTSFSSEDILNFNSNIATQEQINAYGELKRVAEEYGLTIEELIVLLQKMGLVKSESYEQLVEKFGQDLVDTLNDEDLQIAFSVSQDSIDSWDEIIEKINEAKKEAGKEITSLSEIIGSLGDDTIDNYTQKLSSLKSYLDKLKSGDFSHADKLSLADDFGITGDSVEELTEKIQNLMDSEMDAIIVQIDEILNSAYQTNDTEFFNMLSQSSINRKQNNILNILESINIYTSNNNLKARKCAILAELNTRLSYYGLMQIAKPV